MLSETKNIVANLALKFDILVVNFEKPPPQLILMIFKDSAEG